MRDFLRGQHCGHPLGGPIMIANAMTFSTAYCTCCLLSQEVESARTALLKLGGRLVNEKWAKHQKRTKAIQRFTKAMLAYQNHLREQEQFLPDQQLSESPTGEKTKRVHFDIAQQHRGEHEYRPSHVFDRSQDHWYKAGKWADPSGQGWEDTSFFAYHDIPRDSDSDSDADSDTADLDSDSDSDSDVPAEEGWEDVPTNALGAKAQRKRERGTMKRLEKMTSRKKGQRSARDDVLMRGMAIEDAPEPMQADPPSSSPVSETSSNDYDELDMDADLDALSREQLLERQRLVLARLDELRKREQKSGDVVMDGMDEAEPDWDAMNEEELEDDDEVELLSDDELYRDLQGESEEMDLSSSPMIENKSDDYGELEMLSDEELDQRYRELQGMSGMG